MPDDLMLRTCGRTGCRWPAASSLSFRYATRQVWLLDLTAEPDPSMYDLCPHHADSLSVPNGWERVDERTTKAVVAEPAGRDLDPDSGGTAPGAGGYGNRYAALTAALPRLARELREAEGDAADQDAESAHAEVAHAADLGDAAPADVAHRPRDAHGSRADADPARSGGTPSAPSEQLPGQLRIDVEPVEGSEGPGGQGLDGGHDVDQRPEGNVVPIEVGARRRT